MYNPSQDKNALLQCPYDPNHRVRASTWHTHLVKCKKVRILITLQISELNSISAVKLISFSFCKSHPEIAEKFDKCPFNGAHIIRKTEMAQHIQKCPGRAVLENEMIRRNNK